jgi:hypothetical protein
VFESIDSRKGDSEARQNELRRQLQVSVSRMGSPDDDTLIGNFIDQCGGDVFADLEGSGTNARANRTHKRVGVADFKNSGFDDTQHEAAPSCVDRDDRTRLGITN